MPSRAPLRFLFDYISPYAYLAWMQIHALAARHEREVEPVPVLLAGMLQAHGTRGPAEIPAKRSYVFRDAHRLGHRLGVPILPPPAHPFNPLSALRVTALFTGAEQRTMIDALFTAVWNGGAGLATPPDVARALDGIGLDGDALVAAANSDDAKQRIRHNTDTAIAAGVFGVPTILADEEMFWGVDSLANLEAYLRGDCVLDPEVVARWETLPAAATRKL